jgi:uncharacterized membrane protein
MPAPRRKARRFAALDTFSDKNPTHPVLLFLLEFSWGMLIKRGMSAELLPPNKKKSDLDAAAASRPDPAALRPRSKGGSLSGFDRWQADVPPLLGRLLQAYPFLQRHPHPFLVHFSIVFIYATAFFSLLYLASGSTCLEISAFYCLGAGLLFLPPVMLSGELSRRVNYPAEPKQLFRIEIFYSRVLLGLWAGAFLWRWLDPSILRNFRWLSLLYLLLLVAGVVIVTLISYYGGLLTFPLEKEGD